jgi:hypothetical protein
VSDMTTGQIVGGIAGAVIGYFTPVGPVAGFALGSGVGGAIDPQVIEGPRRADLRVQVSELGWSIPILYGICGTSGNVFWAPDLIDVETAGGGSGKGGPEQKNHTYLANFAILICEGPRSLGRIWAGPEKRLVRDAEGLLESGEITFYSGTDDQLPDPLMEAYRGVGNVSANRGWCFLVWKNFSTENDGNMVPFLTIETGAVASEEESGDLGTVWPVGPVHVDTTAGTYSVGYSGTRDGVVTRNLSDDSYVANFHPAGFSLESQIQSFYDDDRGRVIFVGPAGYRWMDTATGVRGEASVFSGWNGIPAGSWSTVGGAYQGGMYVFLMQRPGTPNSYAVSILDPDAYTTEGWFSSPDFFIIDLGTYTLRNGFCGSRDPGDSYVMGVTNEGDVRKFVLSLGGGSTSIGACVANCDHAAVDPNTGYVWVVKLTAGALTVSVHDLVAEASIYSATIATEAFAIGSAPRLAAPFVFGNGLVLLIGDKYLATDYIVQFDAVAPAAPNLITGRYHGTASLGAGWWNPVTTRYWFVRAYGWANATTTGTLDTIALIAADNVAFPGSGFPLGAGGADIVTTQTLAEIVADLFRRAGLSPSQYDVSALESDIPDGFMVTGQTTVRAAIEQLQRAFFFDVREHATADGMVLQCVKRGATAIREIPDEHVGFFRSGSQPPREPVDSVRRMPDELTHTLTVKYNLKATDYSPASRSARRIVGVTGEPTARKSNTLDLSMVLTDTKATQIATANLNTEHVQAIGHTFTLPPEYGDVEPCDILGVYGHVMYVEQVRRTENGLVQHIQAVTDDSGTYDPIVLVEETPPNTQTIGVPGLTLLALLNVNAPRDSDNDAGFIAAACRADPSTRWRGARIMASADGGASYAAVGTITTEATIAETLEALGDFAGGNVNDERNALRLRMRSGSLASTNDDGLLAGVLHLIVGKEEIFGRDVTVEDNGDVTVRGLLRGRRGTGYAMGSHTVGETVVLYEPAKIVRVPQESSDIGVPRLYKGVSVGMSLADTPAQSFTNEGAALECYAPANLAGGRNADGDLLVQAIRGNRESAEWRDYVDVPMTEASEAYEIDIFTDDTFTTVVRTITGLSTPSATYTGDEQIADFGSLQDPVHWEIYQLSAIVGRGRGARAST